MSRRRHTPEQIITALREAEVGLANGKTVAMVSRELGISEQTYYRWRQEFGGMKVDQARRFKELEKENARLKRAVANLTVDKLILEEPLEAVESPSRGRGKTRHLSTRSFTAASPRILAEHDRIPRLRVLLRGRRPAAG